ncbi:bifunctional phosphatase PAP2/diacylglycerol kinase family protein [Gordonia jinhuaensis]|uniref:Phosphoesterase n=1 Tax=Gordonia jinhuaensis TaxID=1517702 RepID=A0A916X1I2_9ACTN|nr:bifunctional phosphatase PAP2/diacylglycerol kinase family protein [Gordonia jinhuaensis]GGB47104.1 phosphoesterase [Gordonia jinhuaensis]
MTRSERAPSLALPRTTSTKKKATAKKAAAKRRSLLPHGFLQPHEKWPAVARFDNKVALRTDAVELGPKADTAILRLSNAADHSKIWIVAGGVLGLTGVRGRRASTRGLGSVAVASLLANVVGKTLFGGDRPTGAGLSSLRRLVEPPRSGSFPSGHSASAAAFATGVAIEWPAAGAAIAPLAAAVCYSRLHVGAHWASDVIGGAALGVGVALVGRAVVPGRADITASEAPGPAAKAPALPRGEGLTVVVNPNSGRNPINPTAQSSGPSHAERIGELLPGADVHVLTKGETAQQVAKDAIAKGAKAIGVCGGDGTVGAVAGVARESGVALALFPGGTLNHFAKALHLVDELHDGDAFAAAASAVEAGAATAVDAGVLSIGESQGVTVLNTFSVGIYPQLVEVREGLEDRLGKWLAAIVATLRTLPKAQPVDVVTADGRQQSLWSIFAGIDRYRPGGLVPAERVRVDDGVLDTRNAYAGTARRRLALVLRSAEQSVSSRLPLLGRLSGDGKKSRSSGFVTDQVQSLEFAVPQGTAIAHDGETVNASGRSDAKVPVVLTMHPGSLSVYVRPDRG